MNIYSIYKPIETQFSVQVDEYQIEIKEVKVVPISSNSKLLVQFMNNGLRNLMSRQGYMEIGKSGKYFNTKKPDNLDDLLLYSGYKANFMELEKGIYLRVDIAQKIVRNQTVLEAINILYKLHGDKEREEKRTIMKN